MSTSERIMRHIFTPHVLEQLKSTKNMTDHLNFRIDVLEASDPPPPDDLSVTRLQYLKAKKAAWETYFSAAQAIGLLDGKEGNDLIAKLRGKDGAHFYSAVAECLSCWYLASKLRLQVETKPKGRGGKMLDLLVQYNGEQFNVEVKAPFWEEDAELHLTEDSKKMNKCLKNANEQFAKECNNILFLVPKYPTILFHFRDPLIQAFYVEEGIALLMDIKTMKPIEPSRIATRPTGSFLRNATYKGNFFKPDKSPRYTRVGAVVVLEEFYNTTQSSIFIDHYCLVLHNPHAIRPISQNIFTNCAQCIKVNDHMEWTA